MADGDDELPSYTPAAKAAAPTTAAGVSRTEHKYSLETKGRDWLLLYVNSRSPKATSPPYFLEVPNLCWRKLSI
jgi:hypothetical protein